MLPPRRCLVKRPGTKPSLRIGEPSKIDAVSIARAPAYRQGTRAFIGRRLILLWKSASLREPRGWIGSWLPSDALRESRSKKVSCAAHACRYKPTFWPDEAYVSGVPHESVENRDHVRMSNSSARETLANRPADPSCHRAPARASPLRKPAEISGTRWTSSRIARFGSAATKPIGWFWVALLIASSSNDTYRWPRGSPTAPVSVILPLWRGP